MKKRILALALCATLMLSLLPGSTGVAANKLTFISVNDSLPPDLINVTVYYGGAVYVPYWLFTNYSFGISYSYFSSSSTAYLFNSANQIFFELASGKTYNSNDVQYNAPAILWGGTVYLPLGFVCSAFGGFTYRTIGQNEYGSILRITTGGEMLGDDEFFKAAAAVMKRYYDAYNIATEPAPPVQATPSPQPSPEPTQNLQPREGDTIHLGLEGMPTPEVLELLEQQGLTGCFFLGADEIRSAPDMVRRIACTGHILGISCPDGQEETMDETASLLWETARIHTVLCTMPEGAVSPDGMVVFSCIRPDMSADERRESVFAVTSELEMRSGDHTMLFPTGDENTTALRMLLYYFNDQGFTVKPLREMNGGETPIMPR